MVVVVVGAVVVVETAAAASAGRGVAVVVLATRFDFTAPVDATTAATPNVTMAAAIVAAAARRFQPAVGAQSSATLS